MTRLFYDLTQIEAGIFHRVQPPPNIEPYVHLAGDIPILLSASHATSHMRKGKMKFEEEYTAAFAVYLARKLNCHAFYPIYAMSDDPNYDADAVYKVGLANIVRAHDVKVVLDLHGMISRHKLGVALGTINGKAFPQHKINLLAPFQSVGFHTVEPTARFDTFDWHRVVLNHPKFTGGVKQQTVTRFVTEQLGRWAIQIELASAIRIVYLGPENKKWPFHYYGDLEGIATAIAGLEEFILRIKNGL